MYINKFKKIVIKIGSSILVDEKGNPKKIWRVKKRRWIKKWRWIKKMAAIFLETRRHFFYPAPFFIQRHFVLEETREMLTKYLRAGPYTL